MSEREEVDALLGMYGEYKELAKTEAQLASQLAKLKARGSFNEELALEHATVKKNLSDLSDKMTFASPIIWMLYKYEAYGDEAQPIFTMHDFRVHCSKEGYICTKRFNFMNKQLLEHGLPPLSDRLHYPDGMLLTEVVKSKEIKEIVADYEFERQWSLYEYYEIDGKPAKWRNYNQA